MRSNHSSWAIVLKVSNLWMFGCQILRQGCVLRLYHTVYCYVSNVFKLWYTCVPRMHLKLALCTHISIQSVRR